MGLIRGSATFTRFYVDGNLTEDYAERLPDQIKRFSFRRLDEHSISDRSTGWVNLMNIFSTDFDAKEFLTPPYLTLSYRIDSRNVPRNALTQHCLEAENEIKKAEGLEFIPRGKKKELRDFIWAQLIKRAIPKTSTYDMIWNLETSFVFFAATSSKVIDEFSDIFFKTFNLAPSPVYPLSLARLNLETEDHNPAPLEALVPIDFKGGKEI